MNQGPVELLTVPSVTVTAAPPIAGSGGGDTAPITNGPQDCSHCSMYFQYINLYFWPTANTNNTACLSGVTDPPATALPDGVTPYDQCPI